MTEEELPKKVCEVFGKKISYHESGEGDPIVLHVAVRKMQ